MRLHDECSGAEMRAGARITVPRAPEPPPQPVKSAKLASITGSSLEVGGTPFRRASIMGPSLDVRGTAFGSASPDSTCLHPFRASLGEGRGPSP